MLDSVLSGHLSPALRVWTALLPALAITLYFLGGLVIYALRGLFRPAWHDREVEARGSTVFLGMWIRRYFTWVIRPVWTPLLRSGLPPDAVTTLSLLFAGSSGVALAAGRFSLGGWLFIAAGICDFLDGRLARATGSGGPHGAALDSVLDRYAEALVFIGLAWYYRTSWVLLPVLIALVGSSLVPYIRARGEALGVAKLDVGAMQRPERVVILGVSLALSPVLEALVAPGEAHPQHWLAVLGILVLAVSSHTTAVRRFALLLRSLGGEPVKQVLGFGRGSLPRAVATSLLATAADFGVVLALVELGALPAWLATALGCLLGGAVSFTLCRAFAFHTGLAPLASLFRYAVVSGSTALLNAGGVGGLLLLPSLDYRLAWLVTRTAVFGAWSYPLFKRYVFPALRPTRATPAPISAVSRP